MATQDNRAYDLLVWGATGFTGRLVAQYMAGRAKTAGLRWAIGGRSAERLAEIKRDLVAAHGATEDEVGVVTGDSTKAADMEAVASQTRAVISTVGPFLKYGTPLVAACVKCGTHYADITGETAWVRRIIDDFHSEAQQKGVCIVPMSGFDSIPADLGTYMLADYVAKKYDARLGVVQTVMKGKGGVSGGTMASMLEMASQPAPSGARPSYPFFLNPRGQWSSLQVTRYDKDQFLPRYHRLAKTWTSMFPMAPINTRVVRRTNALLKDVYGPHFHYNEASHTSGLFAAILFTVVMAILGLLLMFRFTRENVLRRVLPGPGEGPSEEQRARGRFSYEIYGQVAYKDAAAAEGKPKVVKAVVAGRDPGYTETAVMLSEVGIALVELSAQRRLPVHADVGRGGILTPASCLGLELVSRLQAAGLRLYTEDIN